MEIDRVVKIIITAAGWKRTYVGTHLFVSRLLRRHFLSYKVSIRTPSRKWIFLKKQNLKQCFKMKTHQYETEYKLKSEI